MCDGWMGLVIPEQSAYKSHRRAVLIIVQIHYKAEYSEDKNHGKIGLVFSVWIIVQIQYKPEYS